MKLFIYNLIDQNVCRQIQKRFIKTMPRKIKSEVDPRIKLGDYKDYKNHIGQNVFKKIELPVHLEKTINKILSDEKIQISQKERKKFEKFLIDRRRGLEKEEIEKIRQDIVDEIVAKEGLKSNNDSSETSNEELEKFQGDIQFEMNRKIHRIFEIDYNKHISLLYLATRFVPNYSAALQILTEIKKKDPDFSPKHLYDFGSGVGTVMWAAHSLWKDEIIEYMNHDISPLINLISEVMIRDGSISNPLRIKGAAIKRNFSKSSKGEYDLVTCTFTLFDLMSKTKRYETYTDLWDKVKPSGYLVLAEIGTKHGFSLINEAREYILSLISKQDSEGHIFAPCPHQLKCPLLEEGQICKSSAFAVKLNIYDEKGTKNQENEEFKYSYIVFKKAKIDPKNPAPWPRFVYQTPFVVSGGTVRYWLCDPDGQVGHYLASRLRCRVTKALAKYSHLGDNLPVKLIKDAQENKNSQNNNDQEDEDEDENKNTDDEKDIKENKKLK